MVEKAKECRERGSCDNFDYLCSIACKNDIDGGLAFHQVF